MSVPLWIVRDDADAAARLDEFLINADTVLFPNKREWETRVFEVRGATWGAVTGNRKLPDDFVPFAVSLPNGQWDPPDYIGLGGFPLVSRRLRDAVGLSEAVQYLSVTLSAGNKTAVAQDYQLLNVLASQPALDLVRSRHGKRARLRMGGSTFYPPRLVTSYFLLPGIVPVTEIFQESQLPGIFMATDALAERMMKAGCTGVEFMDPATYHVLNGTSRYRTADGIAERWLG